MVRSDQLLKVAQCVLCQTAKLDELITSLGNMGYLEEKDYTTLDNMEKYGGSFVKALANAARHADSINLAKIKETWSDYWHQYENM